MGSFLQIFSRCRERIYLEDDMTKSLVPQSQSRATPLVFALAVLFAPIHAHADDENESEDGEEKSNAAIVECKSDDKPCSRGTSWVRPRGGEESECYCRLPAGTPLKVETRSPAATGIGAAMVVGGAVSLVFSFIYFAFANADHVALPVALLSLGVGGVGIGTTLALVGQSKMLLPVGVRQVDGRGAASLGFELPAISIGISPQGVRLQGTF